MNLDDAALWFYKADADIDAARILDGAYKKHTDLFKIGRQIGATLDITEEDVMSEIKKYRKTKQKIK